MSLNNGTRVSEGEEREIEEYVKMKWSNVCKAFERSHSIDLKSKVSNK